MDIYCMFLLGFQSPALVYVQTNRPKRDFKETLSYFLKKFTHKSNRRISLNASILLCVSLGWTNRLWYDLQRYDSAIWFCSSPPPLHFERKKVLQELGRWGGHHSGGKKDYPLPDMIFWFTGQTKTKPRRHQPRNLTQTSNSLWMWEEVVGQIDIPLFSPHGSSLSPHQPQGICLICVRFAWHAECFAGD